MPSLDNVSPTKSAPQGYANVITLIKPAVDLAPVIAAAFPANVFWSEKLLITFDLSVLGKRSVSVISTTETTLLLAAADERSFNSQPVHANNLEGRDGLLREIVLLCEISS